jgi:hypothetical protein
MVLTIPMALLVIIAGFCQWGAHVVMLGRTYATPTPRYAVGSFIVLVCFAAGWGLDTRQQPVIGLGMVYASSFVATWLSYEADRPKPPTEADADRVLKHIIAEHTDDEPNGREAR